MFKHYVKVALRLIKRSFLFSSVNMLGFVLGMTAAFLIYLWIVDELTFYFPVIAGDPDRKPGFRQRQ